MGLSRQKVAIALAFGALVTSGFYLTQQADGSPLALASAGAGTYSAAFWHSMGASSSASTPRARAAVTRLASESIPAAGPVALAAGPLALAATRSDPVLATASSAPIMVSPSLLESRTATVSSRVAAESAMPRPATVSGRVASESAMPRPATVSGRVATESAMPVPAKAAARLAPGHPAHGSPVPRAHAAITGPVASASFGVHSHPAATAHDSVPVAAPTRSALAPRRVVVKHAAPGDVVFTVRGDELEVEFRQTPSGHALRAAR